MGEIYDAFVETLANWRILYAGRPDQELLHLLLLASEREELVSVGYRESLIARRLTAMPITENVCMLVRQAMVWTWQNEEMHAIYIRGALLKLGRHRITLRVRLGQLAGALGGYASSVRQHLPWSQAPIARMTAAILTSLGIVSGKVPRQVREHLRYRSFRDFCMFNIDTEKTAALCFSRILELIISRSALPAIMAQDFRLVQQDEERHYQLFEILAAAFDGEDRLLSTVTFEELVCRIGAIDEHFLPRSLRRHDMPAPSLGSMAPVFVAKANESTPVDQSALLRNLLESMDVVKLLHSRAIELEKPLSKIRIAIKPSFMFAYHHMDPSPITSIVLVTTLIKWLQQLGCTDVVVIESPSVYEHFFSNRSVRNVASYVGLTSPDVRIIDVSTEQAPHCHRRGMAQYTISQSWKEADIRISFGKLRSHPTDGAMLTLNNLEWLGASHDDLLFAERQAHRQTATIMQIAEFPPHLALLDAYEGVPDGIVGMMGSRSSRAPHRLYGGTDALSVDVVVARHLGMSDLREAPFLRTEIPPVSWTT